ncbi:NifU-like protein 4, mitochondrial [Gracilariopsis chorda]|uniref:NifU-like protein 4, mitochondrial n=1 Tax=Gracilariopsis chorda TaxID=448386 RepID=A0A2V3ITQ6_9FLOR|nr:NifU-like protein 4, mitochondrial [Gracilariopsis chorda]|eukprot:PXF45482.1 NifU-like protein 4, mitochondrial [Gracilariopsis chorda]
MKARQVGAAFRRARQLSAPFAAQWRHMFIQTQPTPNAHAVKFLPGREVLPSTTPTAHFPSLTSARNSPLARRLFAVQGVRSVFFGSDFVTVTKTDDVDWGVLRPEIFAVIMDFFTDATEKVVLLTDDDQRQLNDTAILEDDSEVVAMIKELLETRVKPAVAEDGGTIVFRGFEDSSGTVKLEMQGACSTCSSSSITLKNGVENMLRHYVPEVKRVEQVSNELDDPVEQANLQAFNNMQHKLNPS